MRFTRPPFCHRGTLVRALGLMALAGFSASCREAPDPQANSQVAAHVDPSGPGNAPQALPREVCEEKRRKYSELLASAKRCETDSDCEESSALQTGKHNTSNCMLPLNPARITPEMRATATDYHDACSRGDRLCGKTWPKATCSNGECAWESSSGGTAPSP